MDTWIFLVALFLITMTTFLVGSRISKKRTEDRMADDDAPKSSLAKDGPGPNPVTTPRGEGYRRDGAQVTPQGKKV